MLVLLRLLISITFLIPSISYSSNNMLVPIDNIFVQSEGNNQIEAKLRAYDSGMKRALRIIADKMGLDSGSFDEISRQDLENAFTISKVSDEKFEDGWYSASINYQYDTLLVNEMLLRIAEKYDPNILFNCLFIPVFKQKHTILLWNPKNLWLSYWDKIAPTIAEKKLLYPKSLVASGANITPSNVFNTSYNKFLSLVSDKLFKSVVLAVAEYFTTENGDSYLQVECITINAKGSTKETKRYNIFSKADANRVVVDAANDIVKRIGGVSLSVNNDVSKNTKSTTLATPESDESIKINKMSEYVMYAELYDAASIERMKSKLKDIHSIDHFILTQDKDELYKINILTKDSLDQLTYNLFLNGLTYSVQNGVYRLVQDSSGF